MCWQHLGLLGRSDLDNLAPKGWYWLLGLARLGMQLKRFNWILFIKQLNNSFLNVPVYHKKLLLPFSTLFSNSCWKIRTDVEAEKLHRTASAAAETLSSRSRRKQFVVENWNHFGAKWDVFEICKSKSFQDGWAEKKCLNENYRVWIVCPTRQPLHL